VLRPPENSLGADLIWWRTSDGMRTVVTVLWNDYQPFDDLVHIEARLFAGGRCCAWRQPLIAGRVVVFDSQASGEWDASAGLDGVLALYACTEHEPSAAARKHFDRLYPFVDWIRPDGCIATLHSDQVLRHGSATRLQLTEIVVVESGEESNALVFLNGELEQPIGALRLRVENSLGQHVDASYPEPMAPFSVHRIPLAGLFPGLADFTSGEAAQVSGTFEARGLYCRPYVETEGSRWGLYHGGDRYDWGCLPYPRHALIGGEVNPIAVRHDRDTRSFVNVLHSHGRFEDDALVDVRLFDETGACVAERKQWLVARRHGLARFDLADLLEDPNQSFSGHLALAFAAAAGVDVPRRLQALLEMRRPCSVARTMAWSDEWNSRVRVAKRERAQLAPMQRSFFRILVGGGFSTRLALTNAGHPGHDRDAEVGLGLVGADGTRARHTLRIAPFATSTVDVEEAFPGLEQQLGGTGVGAVVLESASDIAAIGYTSSRRSGSISMEHFMAIASEHDGVAQWPSGH